MHHPSCSLEYTALHACDGEVEEELSVTGRKGATLRGRE